jgi:hypothetical protein
MQKGGKKLRRSSKKKNYYASQRYRSDASKARRMSKRTKRKARWVQIGVKKNGKLVR